MVFDESMGPMNVPRKILAPALPRTFLHREQLLRTLAEAFGAKEDTRILAPYRLILLCAPAGYGKTVLLADTFTRLSLTCCWYFLDRADQERWLFFKTLLASISQRFPQFGSRLHELVADDAGVPDEEAFRERLAGLFTTLALIPGHWVLALCNYQEVNSSPAINELVNRLVEHLPSRCQLVIESRSLPELELASLIAHSEMIGLGRSSLQFSAQEVREFAQIQGLPDFSEQEAVELVASFGGWITGLLLGSRLSSGQFEPFVLSYDKRSPVTSNLIDRRQLLNFVINEVFRHEAELYTFLKEMSLLEKMTPALCNAVLGMNSASALLDYAERQGLFVTCTNESGELVYRCHPILRELFQEELRLHETARYHVLHRQMARLFYQSYAYQEALSHANRAEDAGLVAEILLDVTPQLLDQGQSELVLRSLQSLPVQLTSANPRLLLLQINTYLRRGDFANARRCFELHVSHALDLESVEMRAELSIVRGRLFLHRGEYLLAQGQFEHALEWLPVDERVQRIRAHQQLGICKILSGQPVHEGIAQLQQAFRLCHPRQDERMVGELHHQLANAYEWSGNYVVAEHHRQRIRVLRDRQGSSERIINNLIGLGSLKMRQGQVKEAESLFQTILQLSEQLPRLLNSKAYALLGLGEMELAGLHISQALTYLEEALELARQLEDRYLLNNTLRTLVLVYLQMGDTYTAYSLLGQMELHKQETRSYESVSQQLVHGTILLADQRFDEAQVLLETVVRLTSESGVQWLQIQALIRLAACYLGQNQRSAAKSVLHQVNTLNSRGDHDYCILVEFQAYPALPPLLLEEEPQEAVQAVEVTLLPRRLRIQALGEPLVLIDDVPVTRWRMARAMELFFLLLESKQPLRKDRILTALWSEADENERINQTFRSTIYYLRQVIGDACLVQQSGLYRLDLNVVYDRCWYDVAVFSELQQEARDALERQDDEVATSAFEQMVELYHGDYVEAFYSNWCMSRRDELRKGLMEAHQQLAQIAWRSELWEESQVHWQHLLTLDPCMEEAHYGTMRCYLRQGKRDLALRQYQRCSRELHEQLHTQPGPALQKLYRRLTTASE